MGELVISPVIPPKIHPSLAAQRARRRLRRVPVPELAPVRNRSLVYGSAAVDDRGRIIAQSVLRSLGWSAGTGISICVIAGLIVVTEETARSFRVTSAGNIRIPASIRRWCGLTPGTRVLLVADPEQKRLVLHPPASVDAMVSREYASAFGGDIQ